MSSQAPATQAELDRMAYDMWLDCHRNAAWAGRQMGVSRQTVAGRVRRHLRRPMTAAEMAQLRDLARGAGGDTR